MLFRSGTTFLAITLVSALLVASPRRVLALVPLLAALASVSLTWPAPKTQRSLNSRRHGAQDSANAEFDRSPGSLGAS